MSRVNPRKSTFQRPPSYIESRRQVGHWECDTVTGASHNGADVMMVERKTEYCVIVKIANNRTELVSSAILDTGYGRVEQTVLFQPHYSAVAALGELKLSIHFANPHTIDLRRLELYPEYAFEGMNV